MHAALQDLAGEVARLRAECDYFLRMLDELDRVSRYQSWLSDADNHEITQTIRTYSWSAKENLERATDDLRNWRDQLDSIIRQAWPGR
jgi:hypothetical protein